MTSFWMEKGSGIVLGIMFFFRFGICFWDLLFCPFSLQFAAFWRWKLPFQLYCNILEFEPLIFHGICNILVLVLLRVYLGYNEFQSLGLFRGYLRWLLFFWGVSLGLFRVGLGFVWVKFQIFDFLKGLLKIVLFFWGLVWGWFRVGLGCIYIMHLAVYSGSRSKKNRKQRRSRTVEKAEKQRSRKAKKQRTREAGKGRKAEKQKAEKQNQGKSRKAKSREA